MGSHIQPQAGELDAGFIDDLCGLRVHINIPLALGRIACAVCKCIFVQAKHTRNCDDLPDHGHDLRLLAQRHGNIAHGAGGKDGHLSGVCLDKIDDQIHCVLRAAGGLGFRQEIFRLAICTMGEGIFGGRTDHRDLHPLAHRDIRPADHFQDLQCIDAGHLSRVVSVQSGHCQHVQCLRLTGHHNGHGVVHARVTVQNDLLLFHKRSILSFARSPPGQSGRCAFAKYSINIC